jgi:hypothetical protein
MRSGIENLTVKAFAGTLGFSASLLAMSLGAYDPIFDRMNRGYALFTASAIQAASALIPAVLVSYYQERNSEKDQKV